jgi:hypothetical protein
MSAGAPIRARGEWGSAPQPERLDTGQLCATLALTLAQMLRRGKDAATGAHVSPLRQIGLAMGLLGLAFCANAWRLPPADYQALLFAAGVLFVVLAIAPDTPEVRQQMLEVLHSRPVSERTLVAATGVRLLALSVLIAGVFGLLPHVILVYRGGVPPAAALLSLLSLILAGALMAVLWLIAMLVLLRRVSVKRFRSFSQTAMLVLVLVLMALSLGLPTGGLFESETARSLARWLPSTWFARLAWAPDPGGALPERLAAVGLTLGVALVAWRGGFEGGQWALREDALVAPARSAGGSAGVRLVEAAGRTALLRRRVTPAVASVAALVLAVSSREEVSRLKLFAPRVLTLLTLGAGFVLENRLLPLVMIGFLCFSAVFEGLEVLRQSGDAAASWVLWKAPLERGELLRGLWLALLLRYLALPLGVAALLLGLELHLHLAVAVALLAGLAAGLRLAFATGLWLRPGLPLAAEQHTTQSLLGFGLASGVSFGWTLLALGIGALGQQAAWLGVLVALLVTGSTMAASWSLEQLAEERLARLEFGG